MAGVRARLLDRDADLVARPKVVRVPAAAGAAVEMRDAVLSLGVELRIRPVEPFQRDPVLLGNARERIAGLYPDGLEFVLGGWGRGRRRDRARGRG